MPKMQDNTAILATLEQRGGTCSTGVQLGPGSSPLAINPNANATPAGATGLGPVAVEGSPIPLLTGTEGSTDGGSGSK